nr:DUF4912 domain-containing protein [Neobacillus sp. Marseille-Q6967]
MIEEIIKLREDGLSFRKIASELKTTVGKVQYRWSKWVSNQENLKENSNIDQSWPQEVASNPVRGELSAKLTSPNRILLFWEPSEIPRKLVTLHFNRKFDELVHVIRIYDVTNIIFNGQNAHHFHEITVTYNNGYWFIKGLTANRSYVAELGVKINEIDFFPIYRSNAVETQPIGQFSVREISYKLTHSQQVEEMSPKWVDHVSTYTYYENPKLEEQKANDE